MTERLSRVNLQELETRKDLFQLLESTPLKELLAQQQVKWVVKPRLLSKLDIAFIKTKSGNHYLKGLSILGLHHCVGLIMAPDNSVTSVAQTYDNFHHSPEGQDLLDSGYRVAVLTPQDVKLWQDFYQVTADEHLFEQYANRTHELSGLERYSQLEEQKYTKVFHRLLEENWSKLQEIGINTVGAYQSNRDPNLKFDLTFLDKDLQAVLVPMYHVRELLGHNGLLVEKIRSQETLVPGLITRLAGENKRDAYQRAAQMKEAYLAQYPQAGQSLLVPVISGGQVSLWDKLSVFQPLTNVIKVESAVQPALTTDQLLDFLFMGQNSVNRGELGRLGYSLPGNPKAMLANGGDIGVDLLFLKRNSQGKRELVTLDEPVVVEQVVGRDGKVKTKTMNDVAAMTIVPDTWSDEELKAYIKSAQIFLRHHHPDKYAQVLPVTQQLFELWQQRQSIFSPDDKQPQLTVEPEDQNADAGLNISPEADAKRTQEDIYLGDQAIASQLFIMLARGEAVVGGNTKLIAENDRDQVNLHVADMGMDFDPKYRSSNSLLNQATTNTGILTHLNDQVIPMIPGLYALEYLKAAAQNCPALLQDFQQPVYSYLRAELARRANDAELSELGIEPSALRKLAQDDEQRWTRGKTWQVASAVVQHAHWDHIGNLPLLSEEAAIFASKEAVAELWYMTRKGSRWSSKPFEISYITQDRESRQGSPYRILKRPIQTLEDGQRIKLSKNLGLTGAIIGHSIPGSIMQLWEANGNSLLMTGDIRLDDYGLTERTVGLMAGRADTIVMETTNGPGVDKASAGIKESLVRDNLVREIARNKHQTLIVVTPPNHVERMNSIFEAAAANHRSVAMSGKHLELLNQLRIFQSQSLNDIRSFPYHLPEIGEDVAYWLPNHTKLKTYEEALKSMAEQGKLGIVDLARLSAEPQDWVVVVSPYEDIIKKTQGLVAPHGIKLIWSSYYLYDTAAKQLVTDIARRLAARNDGSELVADYVLSKSGYRVKPQVHPRGPFHASGHATYEQMRDKILIPLLGDINTWSDKTLILSHGSEPGVYFKSLQQQLENEQRQLYKVEQNLKKQLGTNHLPRIIWRLARYDAARPFAEENPFGLRVFSHRWA